MKGQGVLVDRGKAPRRLTLAKLSCRTEGSCLGRMSACIQAPGTWPHASQEVSWTVRRGIRLSRRRLDSICGQPQSEQAEDSLRSPNNPRGCLKDIAPKLGEQHVFCSTQGSDSFPRELDGADGRPTGRTEECKMLWGDRFRQMLRLSARSLFC